MEGLHDGVLLPLELRLGSHQCRTARLGELFYIVRRVIGDEQRGLDTEVSLERIGDLVCLLAGDEQVHVRHISEYRELFEQQRRSGNVLEVVDDDTIQPVSIDLR